MSERPEFQESDPITYIPEPILFDIHRSPPPPNGTWLDSFKTKPLAEALFELWLLEREGRA